MELTGSNSTLAGQWLASHTGEDDLIMITRKPYAKINRQSHFFAASRLKAMESTLLGILVDLCDYTNAIQFSRFVSEKNNCKKLFSRSGVVFANCYQTRFKKWLCLLAVPSSALESPADPTFMALITYMKKFPHYDWL